MEDLKSWCITWPKRALLAGCTTFGGIAFTIILGEEDKVGWDSHWYYPACIAAMCGLLLLADMKDQWRRRLLTLSAGLFFVGEAALFDLAHQADEQKHKSLAFGFVMSLMCGAFAWVPFAVSPRLFQRLRLAELISFAVAMLAVITLWSATEELSLSIQGGITAVLFLHASLNEDEEMHWLTVFSSAFTFIYALGAMLDDSGAACFGAACFVATTALQTGWSTVYAVFGKDGAAEPLSKDFSGLRDSPLAAGMGVACVVSFLGVCMGSNSDSMYSYTWYTVCAFLVPLLMLLARQSQGGRRSAAVLIAAVITLETSSIIVGQIDLLRSINHIVGEATNKSVIAGGSFLLMGMWGCFLSADWATTGAALRSSLPPLADKADMIRAAGVWLVNVGWLLVVFNDFGQADFSTGLTLGFEALVSGAFFTYCTGSDTVPRVMLWVVLFWVAIFQCELMSDLTALESFTQFALVLQWFGHLCFLAYLLTVITDPEAEIEGGDSQYGYEGGDYQPATTTYGSNVPQGDASESLLAGSYMSDQPTPAGGAAGDFGPPVVPAAAPMEAPSAPPASGPADYSAVDV